MIGLAISCRPLNTSHHIQRKQVNNFKHVILGNTPSTPYYESLQAHQFMKHAKYAILLSTPSTPFYEAREFFEVCKARQFFEARQAYEHVKHVSTPNT